ncbi:aldo/keto reductase [Cellulosilyticum ruminicola]|uniref:aldo/keto reductase n=1 Tax=Cellulosilyticum ruminicola TaxID=425254 RepID=UPI0006D24435|nr:aldo/keto reductase [Cellulosilyticum ruminicola]
MKKIHLGSSNIEVSAVAVGCMRMSGLTVKEAESYILSCMEQGLNFFDHADIYGGGQCEEIFGQVLAQNPGLREKMFLQSKCGIIPGKMYDLSKKHILESVEGSLKRLQIDHLDMLLLHRPDALMEPEEVAEAFDTLQSQGKVKHFGVSNQNPMQMKLLQKYMKQPILVNQLQFSVPVSNMVSVGMEVNMNTDGAINRDGSVLDYCRLNDITIQAWSPFQKPNWGGLFLDSEDYAELNKVLEEIAANYDVTTTTIATAWILRHPANMQVIAGSMKTSRMTEIAKAADIKLTREEWYKIYLSAGHLLP